MWRGQAREPKRVLITGIPGTKLGEAVRKVPLPIGKKLRVYKVEELLLKQLNAPHIMMALCKPKFVLYKALSQVLQDLALELDQQTDDTVSFILAHGVYYLGDRQEFVYLLQESSLRCLQLDAAITLIDDIYDVFMHLNRRGEIFGLPGSTTEGLHVIFSLIHLLHWREQEFAFSQHLTAELSLPHILLAVKHPVETLSKWLFTNGKCVYLSHPITDLRAGLDQGDESILANVRHINRLADTLSEQQNCVLFVPTAIDELRFAEVPFRTPATSRLMLKRWPLLRDHPRQLLHVPPSGGRPNLDDLFAEATEKSLHELQEALKILRRDILRQIAFRDRVLVDQCDGVFLWRPYHNGRLSAGMRDELRHLVELQKHDPDSHRFAVIHMEPQEEWAHVIANELVGAFASSAPALDLARFLSAPDRKPLWRRYVHTPGDILELEDALSTAGFQLNPRSEGALSGHPEFERKRIWANLCDRHQSLKREPNGTLSLASTISNLLGELQAHQGRVVKNMEDNPSEKDACSDLLRALGA